MKVELLSHTPSKELLQSLPVSEVPVKKFLRHLSFTFAIEGISRACSHQLVRHRVASFSQQSQRYIQVKTTARARRDAANRGEEGEGRFRLLHRGGERRLC